jgi:hypothetical protein
LKSQRYLQTRTGEKWIQKTLVKITVGLYYTNMTTPLQQHRGDSKMASTEEIKEAVGQVLSQFKLDWTFEEAKVAYAFRINGTHCISVRRLKDGLALSMTMKENGESRNLRIGGVTGHCYGMEGLKHRIYLMLKKAELI